MNLKGHLQYLWYVLRHKWFVFLECCKIGVPVLGILHDWSKFRLSEWTPYVHYFYPGGKQYNPRDKTGYYKPTNTGDDAFDFAWLLHQKRNKHHWQWWILPCDDGTSRVFEMPLAYRREMLADWRGAGRALGTPGTAAWYRKNEWNMRLGPLTRRWIGLQLFGEAKW